MGICKSLGHSSRYEDIECQGSLLLSKRYRSSLIHSLQQTLQGYAEGMVYRLHSCTCGRKDFWREVVMRLENYKREMNTGRR